jgi:hypothetical protein
MTGPMLFPRNPAKGGTSGPQAWFGAEKGLLKMKVGKNKKGVVFFYSFML